MQRLMAAALWVVEGRQGLGGGRGAAGQHGYAGNPSGQMFWGMR
jgi:hypothetical protein